MSKPKLESTITTLGRQKPFQTLLFISLVYFLFLTYQFSFLFYTSGGSAITDAVRLRYFPLDSEEETLEKESPSRPSKLSFSASPPTRNRLRSMEVSGLVFDDVGGKESFSEAWELGKKMFLELENAGTGVELEKQSRSVNFEACPSSIALSGSEFIEKGKVMVLSCGLTLGSHITLVAKPYQAHPEYEPQISTRKVKEGAVMISQFMMELRGLNIVDGEEPPRILHFNPRLRGDWSSKPVIEMNTCYRMQWGQAQRCEGWKSRADEETVDDLVKCEKWILDDDNHTEESKTNWWLKRLIGRTKREVSFDWPYPFVEDKLFVLTLSAGLEGYHINVDGRHITSFPYRTGFVLEDATGLSLNGDLDIQSLIAGSLPTSHPSLSRQRYLEMSKQWQAPPLPDGPIELFIGILSAGNHFAERMAVRKSWMQSISKSPNVVARFFVALHGRNEVNLQLRKEAEFFGDIVIVPYLDSYDLVVLKTIAICEYGVRDVSAKYIMKCDDDTFIRVNLVLKEVREVSRSRSIYVGNINYHHKPLRYGKWAVTYEEWPEEDYPPYANGPGYIITSDIAHFVILEFEKHKLRLFKMEDVSMGMWVEKFNSTTPVAYIHNSKYYQSGCNEDYYTAHYQSPRQMICMWEKLQSGKPQCCNMR